MFKETKEIWKELIYNCAHRLTHYLEKVAHSLYNETNGITKLPKREQQQLPLQMKQCSSTVWKPYQFTSDFLGT